MACHVVPYAYASSELYCSLPRVPWVGDEDRSNATSHVLCAAPQCRRDTSRSVVSSRHMVQGSSLPFGVTGVGLARGLAGDALTKPSALANGFDALKVDCFVVGGPSCCRKGQLCPYAHGDAVGERDGVFARRAGLRGKQGELEEMKRLHTAGSVWHELLVSGEGGRCAVE